MKSTSYIKYKYSYFEHPVLTKILGGNTYDTLHTLNTELTPNSRAITTTLGGVNQSYLVMLLIYTEYNHIYMGILIVCPPNLGLLAPPPAGTAAKITAM